jgi:hypothetical protein
MLQGSKKEALLAVDLCNRPGDDRRLEAFVVHMQIAWTYLLHAKLVSLAPGGSPFPSLVPPSPVLERSRGGFGLSAESTCRPVES